MTSDSDTPPAPMTRQRRAIREILRRLGVDPDTPYRRAMRRLTGISPSTVSRWATGESEQYRNIQVELFARNLKLHPDEVLGVRELSPYWPPPEVRARWKQESSLRPGRHPKPRSAAPQPDMVAGEARELRRTLAEVLSPPPPQRDVDFTSGGRHGYPPIAGTVEMPLQSALRLLVERMDRFLDQWETVRRQLDHLDRRTWDLERRASLSDAAAAREDTPPRRSRADDDRSN